MSSDDDWHLAAIKTKGTTFEMVCQEKGLTYTHGCGYYQLGKKTENISAAKKLVAMNEETGEIISGTGAEVRTKLGIALDDTKLSAGDVPDDHTLYVNSTSANRGLAAGTTVLIYSPVAGGKKAVVTNSGKKHNMEAVAQPPQQEEEEAPMKRKKKEEPAAAPPKKVPVEAPKTEAPAAPLPKKVPVGSSLLVFSATTGVALTQEDSDGWKWYATTLMLKEKPDAGKVFSLPSAKIAAFDYDGCLANTSLFKKGPDAWSVLFPTEIPETLKELHDAGYRLVIMSNQATIGKATKSKDATIHEKKARFEGFVEKIGLPFTILAATASTKIANDPFRKPACGMWNFIEDNFNNGVKIDKKKSFYVGDAAGRKKDHSDSDKKCAEKYGVSFYTETEAFKEKKYRAQMQ